MILTEKERVIQALKFVKVELTKDGYLTPISVAMLLVEMERRGIVFAHTIGFET